MLHSQLAEYQVLCSCKCCLKYVLGNGHVNQLIYIFDRLGWTVGVWSDSRDPEGRTGIRRLPGLQCAAGYQLGQTVCTSCWSRLSNIVHWHRKTETNWGRWSAVSQCSSCVCIKLINRLYCLNSSQLNERQLSEKNMKKTQLLWIGTCRDVHPISQWRILHISPYFPKI